MKYNFRQCEDKDTGIYTFYIDDIGDACIDMFAILPEYQGKGIGVPFA